VNIYIGNLAYGVTSDDLNEAFGAFGEISRATVITDRETGRSKGFGFVEMPNDDEARKAIEEMNDKPLSGRNIRVNEAKPREDRSDRPRRPRF
jgi:RNA recognition motif-containing protein